jgi:NDP-sugar pyrophosphorylase family protein
MQAVILAGGKGTRLRPLTYEIPKSMISIHGRPFLEYLLELIKPFGINEVLLLIGYLGEHIEKYFGNGLKFGLKVEYSYEKTLLGTGGALKNAADKLAKEFLLLNGDTFLPIDYGELIKHFHRSNKIGTVTVFNNTERIVPNNIAVGESNLVIDYNKKDSVGMTHVDAGAMVFKKDVLDIIPKTQICSLEEKVFHKLIRMRQLLAFPTNQRFYDTGSLEGLRLVEEVLR